jgi:hypothetical protein
LYHKNLNRSLKSVYKKIDEFEYCIDIENNLIINAFSGGRKDTYDYRQNKLRSQGSWRLISARTINNFIKLPHRGKINYKGRIFFFAQNLKFDKPTQTFIAPDLKFFEGLTSHKIKIKNIKTDIVKEFVFNLDIWSETKEYVWQVEGENLFFKINE